MATYGPDALGIVGLGLLVAGVAMQFGLTWALMVSGAVLMGAGVAIAWRRNR